MIKSIDKQAYKLKLSQTMKIHDIFHVLLLKLCDKIHKSNVLSPQPINIESKNKYKIKKNS